MEEPRQPQPAKAPVAKDLKARVEELRRPVRASPEVLAQARALGARAGVVVKESAAAKDLGKGAPSHTPDARGRQQGTAVRERFKQLPGTERGHPPSGTGSREPANLAARYRGQEPAQQTPAAPQKQREERSR